MAIVRRVGERGARWHVRDLRCIGCLCFQPGTYEHRAATQSSSRDTGYRTLECLHRAYYGCPKVVDYSTEWGHIRRLEGWRNV